MLLVGAECVPCYMKHAKNKYVAYEIQCVNGKTRIGHRVDAFIPFSLESFAEFHFQPNF